MIIALSDQGDRTRLTTRSDLFYKPMSIVFGMGFFLCMEERDHQAIYFSWTSGRVSYESERPRKDVGQLRHQMPKDMFGKNRGVTCYSTIRRLLTSRRG
jgi:hypothetical protein